MTLMQRMIFLFPNKIQMLYAYPNITQSFETVWTVIDSVPMQQLWGRTFHEISRKIDSLILKQRQSDERPFNPSNHADLQTIEIMPSFFLIKLIFNQFLPKALQNHKQTHITQEMLMFTETLCRETDVVQFLHLTHPSHSINKIVSELAMHVRERPINEVVSS